MANTQAIKHRITSVKNTKQITKAMELVAASKLRRAQEQSSRSRAYKNSAREILARLSQLTRLQDFELYQVQTISARLTVVFTSDRGLAGAYNSNILKKFLQQHTKDQDNSVVTKVIVIGRKGAQALARIEGVELVGVYNDWPNYPNSHDIAPLFENARKLFVDGEVQQVDVLYTDYKSSIMQEATQEQLLPANLADEIEGVEVGRDINDAIFEPSPDEVVRRVVPRLVEIQLYQFALEASASEQSMRMMAMKSASDNAGDLIDDLTLEFNSARQAAITQELAEITGGAAAIS